MSEIKSFAAPTMTEIKRHVMKTWLFHVLFSFAVLYKEFNCNTTYCFGHSFTGEDSNISTECVNEFNNEVCLICNISPSSRNIAWFGNNKGLAKSQYNIDGDHPGYLSLRQCVEDRYTLTITKPTISNYDIIYHCQQNDDIISLFKVKLKAFLKLYLETTLILNGTLITRKQNTLVTLDCFVREAIPPFTLTWSVNGAQARERLFKHMANASSPYRDSFNATVTERQYHEISCTVEGKYLSRGTTFLRISTENVKNDNTEKDGDKTQGVHHYLATNVRWILIVFLSIILLLFTVYLVLSGYMRTRKFSRESVSHTARLSNDQLEQDSMYGTYEQVQDSFEITHFNGGEESFFNTSLTRKISSSGTYEYWCGTYSTDDDVEKECVAKILSDLATRQDVSAFKMLATRLQDVSSSHVAKILCCDIKERPYRIIYERLDSGPLKEYLIQRSKRSLNMCSDVPIEILEKWLKDLLLFASDIATAMCFLNTRNFCHPVLSLKKVLLTPENRCKLYDIYPNDLATMKVKTLMRKINPPLAWMPPEMLKLKKHFSDSDVWSFAVLLWELFSFGKTPLAGFATPDIEVKQSNGYLLEKPNFCPGAVYDIMLTSWTNKSGGRPTFEKIHAELQTMFKAVGNEEKSSDCSPDGRFYFTLDTHYV